MKCPHCGTDMAELRIYCPKCKNLAVESEELPAAKSLMQQISIWSVTSVILPLVGPLLGIVACLIYNALGTHDDRLKIRQILSFTILGILIDAVAAISFFPNYFFGH